MSSQRMVCLNRGFWTALLLLFCQHVHVQVLKSRWSLVDKSGRAVRVNLLSRAMFAPQATPTAARCAPVEDLAVCKPWTAIPTVGSINTLWMGTLAYMLRPGTPVELAWQSTCVYQGA